MERLIIEIRINEKEGESAENSVMDGMPIFVVFRISYFFLDLEITLGCII